MWRFAIGEKFAQNLRRTCYSTFSLYKGFLYPEDERSVFHPAMRYLLLRCTVFRPRHVRNKVENPYETVLYAVSQKLIGIPPLTFKHSGYYIYIYTTQSPAFTFKNTGIYVFFFFFASQNTQKLLT